jgi:hypothetical protein
VSGRDYWHFRLPYHRNFTEFGSGAVSWKAMYSSAAKLTAREDAQAFDGLVSWQDTSVGDIESGEGPLRRMISRLEYPIAPSVVTEKLLKVQAAGTRSAASGAVSSSGDETCAVPVTGWM